MSAASEKTGWSVGMALRCNDVYYRLHEIVPPAPGSSGWTYCFGYWPQEQVFRRLVDYEQDSAEPASAHELSLKGRLQRWISRKPEER